MQGTCDVCNAATSWAEGTGYTADEFRELVGKGFEPDPSLTQQAAVFGISADAAIERWKNDLVASSTSGWLLCPRCAERASGYSSKTAGADPSDFVLSEELTIHPFASATAPPIPAPETAGPPGPSATTAWRSRFTDDEWQTLRFAPFWAFHLVARADGRADEDELGALYRQFREAATQKAPLAREVFVSIAADQDAVQRAYFADPRTVTDGLREVVRILEAKVGHEEAVMFKGAVAWVAVDTANASGPSGDPIELDEARAIGVVWEALGFEPDEFYAVAPAYGFSATPPIEGVVPAHAAGTLASTTTPTGSVDTNRAHLQPLPPPPEISGTAWRPRTEPAARKRKPSKAAPRSGERGRVSGVVFMLLGAIVLLGGMAARESSQAIGVTDIVVGTAMIVAGVWMRRGRRGGFVLLGILGGAGFLWWAGFFTAYLTGLVRPAADESVWDFLFLGVGGMVVTGLVLAYGVRALRRG